MEAVSNNGSPARGGIYPSSLGEEVGGPEVPQPPIKHPLPCRITESTDALGFALLKFGNYPILAISLISAHPRKSAVKLCGKVFAFPITRDHPITAITRSNVHSALPALLNPSIKPFNAITSTGQSGQLCSQHRIKSHSFGSWKCCRKLRLRNSISIRTLCHRPGATSRNASTSGYCVPIHVTIKPSFSAIAPNRNTTPISFTGAKPSADRRNGSPYTGRSFRIFGPEFHPFQGPGDAPPAAARCPCCLVISSTSAHCSPSPFFSAYCNSPPGTCCHEPNLLRSGPQLCWLRS